MDLDPTSPIHLNKKLRETGILSRPERSKWGQYNPEDDFDEVAIRNKVHELTHRHQLPTINTLLSVLKKISTTKGAESN